MTRKDFILIAEALKEATTYANYQREQTVRDAHALQCDAFCKRLIATNERFNRVRFLKACGLSDDTIENL